METQITLLELDDGRHCLTLIDADDRTAALFEAQLTRHIPTSSLRGIRPRNASLSLTSPTGGWERIGTKRGDI